jgi:hypothetical protein
MCANDYPDSEKDLKPRVLEVSEYLSLNGNTYLVPELNLPKRRSRSRVSLHQGLTYFEFETPTGETINVPTGSTVKCVLSNPE